jgi:serine/threonine-protein kinase
MTAVIGLPPPGALLDGGRIVLGSKCAEGGMSVVHVAVEKATQRCLAVKLLIERYKGRPEREQRLIDEGRYLEQLGPSRHIVELVSHGRLAEFDGWPFVATEFMAGSSLRRLILSERELPLWRICDIARQLAQAIQLVHQRGIVHRDVTTSNVYVCRDPFDADGPDHVKLFDFSHAGRLDGPRGARGTAGRLTGIHDVPGTHGYMSPEQARAEPVTTAMDVFSFGAVLYELVTRSSLFDIRDRTQYINLAARGGLEVPKLQAWAYEIPEALAELTNASTDLDPAARPSMDEVVERLAAIRVSLGIASEEPTERVPLERLPVRAPVVAEDDEPTRARPRRADPAEIGDWTPGPQRARVLSRVDEPKAPCEPTHGSVHAEAEQTDIELPFARPAHLRPTISPVVVAPQSESATDASPTTDEADSTPTEVRGDAAPSGAGWRWIAAGAGLLVALGLGGWVWVGHERETAKEDGDPALVGVGPSVEPESAGPNPSESDTGPHLEPVPEVEEPKNGDPKNGEPKNGEPKNGEPKHGEPKHGKPDPCEGKVEQARSALASRDWRAALKFSSSSKCWSSQEERAAIRVTAYMEIGEWSKCVDAGAGVKNAEVRSAVDSCRMFITTEESQ